ncbi:hypothetical protein HZC21_01240 [Candidatus Peregrinibacteria bacterium]|nr:hypothetical protein [Candidatus Peregrinibacteria bacterium]
MIQTDNIQNAKRSWGPIIIGIAFSIIALLSIYFEIRQSGYAAKIEKLTAKKEELNTQLKANKIETGSAAEAIKKELEQIEAAQLNWSKIIEKIENAVPRLKNSNVPVVNIRSYNGSEEGIISANAVTRPDSPDPFADTALLITAFNSEPSFKRVFVPSISKSITPEGGAVLSFSINFQYEKANF